MSKPKKSAADRLAARFVKSDINLTSESIVQQEAKDDRLHLKPLRPLAEEEMMFSLESMLRLRREGASNYGMACQRLKEDKDVSALPHLPVLLGPVRVYIQTSPIVVTKQAPLCLSSVRKFSGRMLTSIYRHTGWKPEEGLRKQFWDAINYTLQDDNQLRTEKGPTPRISAEQFGSILRAVFSVDLVHIWSNAFERATMFALILEMAYGVIRPGEVLVTAMYDQVDDTLCWKDLEFVVRVDAEEDGKTVDIILAVIHTIRNFKQFLTYEERDPKDGIMDSTLPLLALAFASGVFKDFKSLDQLAKIFADDVSKRFAGEMTIPMREEVLGIPVSAKWESDANGRTIPTC
ncbi:hypothetical protein QFC24_005614 [Naganishia onofrii]|uniref:Uncharacterized protein n=1 Tax=Naganishia onofrii TaxID=1851511 RepID=A0ACC2X914_9TREE|nr:hypothetical protein QFC24_005614 [Naganishia onofrii]